MTTSKNQPTVNRPSWIYLFSLTLCLLAIGVLFAWWMANSTDRALRDILLQQTHLVANALDLDKVKALSGTQADLDSPEYLQLKERLAAVNSANPKSRFVYLMGRRSDGTVFFFLDSEPAGSEDESSAGEIYAEASADIIRAFETQTEVVEGPISDRWGEWISVLVPLTDPGSGNLVALLGIDIDAKTWRRDIAAQAALPIALSLVLLGLLVSIIILARSRHQIISYKQALGESEEKYRSIFQNAPLGLLHFNREGIITSCNDRLVEIIGSTREKFMGLSMLTLPDKHLVQAVKLALNGERGHYDDEYRSVTSNKVTPLRALFTPINSEQGEIVGGVGIIEDVTERKQIEKQLKFLSFHDQLTGLYNRNCFEYEMQRLSKSREHPITIICMDVDGLKMVNDTLGHDQGDKILKQCADLLREIFRKSDIVARTGGDEFAALLPKTDKQAAQKIVRRIRTVFDDYNQQAKPNWIPLSISIGISVAENADNDLFVIFKEADDLMYRDKLSKDVTHRSRIMRSLLAALEERDFMSHENAQKMEKLCRLVGKKIDLPEKQLSDLALLVHLHDIGNAAVPDHVLFKQGPLTEEEWRLIYQHPEKGYRIAKASIDLAEIGDLILKHHERWDGEGYPLGLEGEDIPIECRIFSIIDAYDAMTSDRPYRKARSEAEAREEIRKCSGTQFDPELAEMFLEVLNSEDQSGKQNQTSLISS